MSIVDTNTLIAAGSLGKRFGDVVAVHDVSFTVGAGEVFGLLGPNGAGKTTVVRMLATLSSIDSGSASIAGHDVAAEPDAVRRVIGLAGQAAAVDEKLSARENLELFARLYKLPKPVRRRRIAELIDSKAGLAARALDGSDAEVSSSANIQTEALVALLTDALERELG